ncbi:cytochrome bd oxidase small subunit CydS [Halalkalibacillus halophilus]
MTDFIILYAPLIVLVGAIGLAFFVALKESEVDDK